MKGISIFRLSRFRIAQSNFQLIHSSTQYDLHASHLGYLEAVLSSTLHTFKKLGNFSLALVFMTSVRYSFYQHEAF